ncbi:MAG: RNA polymerase sigma factor [Planctomycetaceae bacterium]|jgi:RNA polymerase sigma-70 factor (ECF subfamily)|nr:RNA polymerase sigma factor [Planctomycetaceae bacterium]
MDNDNLLYEAIRRYAARLLGNYDTALDITQEVFVRLQTVQQGGTSLRSEKAFVYQIARNLVIDHFRKKKMSDLPDGIPADATRFSPPLLAEQKETAQMIQDKMNALPPRQREVLRLKFQEGLKYAEIAEVIGEPVTTVAWLLHEAVAALRKELNER